MKNSMNEVFTLNDGNTIPCLGYGTWKTPDGDTAKECVCNAIKAGYRHIDTAWGYGNEAGVGEGIRASGVKREEIYLTTKHWVIYRGYKKTIETIKDSLKNLGTDYIDLYLMHWPCVEASSKDWKEINAETWSGFEDMKRQGYIRSIGVSNFQKKHIDALNDMCRIHPAVNQLEFHPGYTQIDNVKYMQSIGICVEAWSPLGSGEVLNDPLLAQIAAKYNKSVAQLCIRFALQNDVLPLPKSSSPERTAQNADVFDFTISDEDMATLFAIDGLGFSTYLPEDAPADKLAGLIK